VHLFFLYTLFNTASSAAPPLKVLSSEIDPAEIRFEKVFIKERGAEVFRKMRHPPSCVPPLPISWREKQHSNFKKFSAPLATDSKSVHGAVANSSM